MRGNQKPWKIHWNHERKDSSDFGSLGKMEPFMIVYVHECPTTFGLAEQVFGCEDKRWDPETGCFPRDMKNLHGIPNALVIKVFTDSGNYCPFCDEQQRTFHSTCVRFIFIPLEWTSIIHQLAPKTFRAVILFVTFVRCRRRHQKALGTRIAFSLVEGTAVV